MKNKTIPQHRYYTKRISKADAVAKLKEQPNLTRTNPNMSYGFGLFDSHRSHRLVGVVSFGSPASPSVARGLCGDDEKLNIVELNALWADTSVSNDAVKFFLSEALMFTPKDIILSYVPTEAERVSNIYKQLGFLYTGLTKERTNRVDVTGEVKHNRDKDYDKLQTYLVPRPRKHRFVLFNVGARQHRKAQLVSKLKYDVHSY